MWTEDTERGMRLAYGKVHRAVNGEAHQFDDWQGLLERLRGMVSDDKGIRAPEDTQAQIAEGLGDE
jgi:hypothetical protein